MSESWATKGELAVVNERLNSHEDVCSERYKRIDEHLIESQRDRAAMWNEMKIGFNGIYTRLWIAAGSLIGLLVVALAYFLDRAGLPGH